MNKTNFKEESMRRILLGSCVVITALAFSVLASQAEAAACGSYVTTEPHTCTTFCGGGTSYIQVCNGKGMFCEIHYDVGGCPNPDCFTFQAGV